VSELLPKTIQAAQAWEKPVLGGGYDEQLWSGEDPHFYPSLVWSLWKIGISCLGRPTSPPTFDSGGKPLFQSSGKPSFEVRVSESDLPLARWALESLRETFERGEITDGVAQEAQKKRDEPVSACPLCGAEFAVGTPNCPNCRVGLRISYDESDVRVASRVLCALQHPQFARAIRRALLNAGIPFNNAGHVGQDAILGRRTLPSYEVIVLDSDYDRATNVLALLLQHWEFEPGSGLDRPQNPLQSYWPVTAVESGWLPEDLTVTAWSGGNLDTFAAAGSALREHRIPYALDMSTMGCGKLSVHPEDESRAREVLTEVVEGVPPE
jgi:hypothetical protein